ncbi:hypothetical protein Btru_067181 [Bulinus truncatus]|nr:hypothetical protein Btru_067181 [Bulinus truncatus]
MSNRTLVNIFLSTVCLLLVLYVTEVRALQTKFCTTNSRPHLRGRCGADLVDTMQGLCSPYSNRIKRNTAAESSELFTGLTLNKPSALSYLTKREPGYNLVCECCMHHCTINEMLAYCSS